MDIDITGTWDMMSWYNETDTGERHDPLGEAATGYISYTSDGHVCVSLSRDAREAFALHDPVGGADAENTAAMRSHITYSGVYGRVEGAGLHHVRRASFPNWVGSEQRRTVTGHPDGTLTRSAAEAPFNGRDVTTYVHWRRVNGN